MGIPNWLGGPNADSTLQTAIMIAAGLLVLGIGIALYIVRVRKRRDRQSNNSRAVHYQSKTQKKTKTHATFD